jgi:SAM-dependent methyltransferase
VKGRGRAPQGPIERRDRVIRTYLRQIPSDSLVLNIGCGLLGQRLEKACRGRYFSTDLRVLPQEMEDFAADAACLPLADGSVDVVVALELLEHVPQPRSVIEEFARVLKPGGRVFASVPSAVPRHSDHDYWRFTAQGLDQLCSDVFENTDVQVFGGTFEALGYLAQYYSALVFHRVRLPSGPLPRTFLDVGYWLDRHNNWSTSTTALHTLAFDLLVTATTPDH